jgi:3-methyladenine DNA glycosylase/8-oxoguanine DNA glycosylase
MDELSSMLKAETNNSQSMTKQLVDGISLLKETNNKLSEVKTKDKKQRSTVAQLQNKITKMQKDKVKDVTDLKTKASKDLKAIIQHAHDDEHKKFATQLNNLTVELIGTKK